MAAPTSVAAFNIEGHTLHSLLSLPTKGEYKHLGSSAYQLFDCAIVLDQVMRQSAENDDQVRFCNILLCMRDGEVTEEDI